jgi:hypothetical protein
MTIPGTEKVPMELPFVPEREHGYEPYVIEAFYPNSVVEPQRFWMTDLEAALDVARAIAHDGSFAWVQVLDQMRTERAKFYLWDLQQPKR